MDILRRQFLQPIGTAALAAGALFASAACVASDLSLVQATNVSCKVGRANVKPGESVTWQGMCKDGLAEGTGVARWSFAGKPTLVYEGAFVRGLIEGKGKMSGADGDRYEGDFKGAVRDGFGRYSTTAGVQYEGLYRNNQRAPGATASRMAAASASDARPAAAAPAPPLPPAAGGKFALVSCIDQTRQGARRPFRDQQASVSASVGADVVASFERAPKVAPKVALSDTIMAKVSGVLAEAIRLAGDKCGIKYPRSQSTLGSAVVFINLFKDRLPTSTTMSYEDQMQHAASFSTFDGAVFAFTNGSDPQSLAEKRSSLQASHAAQSAQAAQQQESMRERVFLSKYSLQSFTDAQALLTNPFTFEGKNVVVRARFGQMLTATKVLLVWPAAYAVVMSDVPRGTFDTQEVTS